MILDPDRNQEPDAFIIKTDETGNVEWNRTYGDIDEDRGVSVLETTDGGYLLAGTSRQPGTGRDKAFIVKTDVNGNELWSNVYGGEVGDRLESVVEVEDGFVATGVTHSMGSGGADMYLLKVDLTGDLVWSKAFGGSRDDHGLSVMETLDDGLVVVGYSGSFEDVDGDVYVVRTDSEGELVWESSFGGGDTDVGYSVDVTDDGGYIITGESKSFGGMDEVYLFKLTPDVEVDSNRGIPGYSMLSIGVGCVICLLMLNKRHQV